MHCVCRVFVNREINLRDVNVRIINRTLYCSDEGMENRKFIFAIMAAQDQRRLSSRNSHLERAIGIHCILVVCKLSPSLTVWVICTSTIKLWQNITWKNVFVQDIRHVLSFCHSHGDTMFKC